MKPPPSLQAYSQNRQADQADGTLVKYRGLRSMLARLLFLVPTAGSGIQVTLENDGPVWSATGGSSSATPLFVSATGRVTPGTVGGIYPTISGTSIADNPAPLLTIPTSGTRHVVLNIDATLALDGTTYVTGYSSLDAVTLTVETTDPGSAGLKSSAGTFQAKLATFVDGVKTSQLFSATLNLRICDDGSGGGVGLLVLSP